MSATVTLNNCNYNPSILSMPGRHLSLFSFPICYSVTVPYMLSGNCTLLTNYAKQIERVSYREAWI